MKGDLVCISAGLGVQEGQQFPVLAENKITWEILLGGSYRKVSKKSGRVRGWRNGPQFKSTAEEVVEPEASSISTSVYALVSVLPQHDFGSRHARDLALYLAKKMDERGSLTVVPSKADLMKALRLNTYSLNNATRLLATHEIIDVVDPKVKTSKGFKSLPRTYAIGKKVVAYLRKYRDRLGLTAEQVEEDQIQEVVEAAGSFQSYITTLPTEQANLLWELLTEQIFMAEQGQYHH
ncbi:hypothetical protein CJP16_07275 [Aeromonas sobria]|uniref:Uncharacterized protein n=1 Tax=Aeromonas sobria TaxID=646 RepID=A0A2N3J463_AERSO|nr:hypothetical protein [Aeromonas sobria]PKQ80580.1 hypothetical protein CJP16_07275 [Aeromonas sobria]